VTATATKDCPPRIPGLRFLGVAGRGGMSVVWRAHGAEYARDVAVKVLDPAFAGNGQDVRQFMAEVRAMRELEHPGIVHAYEADCVDGRYYYVMDFVDGVTLSERLRRKAAFAEEDLLIVCESVAAALRYAWDRFRMVHCDIKPENLMVDADGSVKLTDLGLCRLNTALRRSTASEEVLGTPAYISPEQVYGDAELDARSDIYSLGASLYHMATGRILFPLKSNDDMLRAHVDPAQRAPDPRKFAPDLSEGFVRMLGHMLVKEKERRLATWDDVLDAALAVERGQAILPLPPDVASSVAV